MKLSALMLPPYAAFHTEPAVIQPGKEADMVITVDGGKLPDTPDDRWQFNFMIEGIDAPITDRMVKVTVKRLQ